VPYSDVTPVAGLVNGSRCRRLADAHIANFLATTLCPVIAETFGSLHHAAALLRLTPGKWLLVCRNGAPPDTGAATAAAAPAASDEMPLEGALYANELFIDITTNPKYKDIWAAVLANDHLLCVPQVSSLQGKVTADSIKTHVLVGDASEPGMYRTLNNKGVCIVGNSVRTVAGFPEKREVTIIYTQRVTIDGDGAEVTVLYLAKPLAGGVSAPPSPDDMTAEMIDGYIAMFYSYPEMEGVMEGLKSLCRQINTLAGRGELHRVKPSLAKVIAEKCRVASEVLVAHVVELNNKQHRDECLAQIMQTVRCFVMTRVHKSVFPWVCEQHRATNDKLHKICALLVGLHPLGLHPGGVPFDIAPAMQCEMSAAVRSLASLDSLTSPLLKVQCLERTSQLVKSTVQKHLEATGEDIEKVEFGTDDLLAQLLFVIAKCYCETGFAALFYNVAYIQQFHLGNLNTTAMGCGRRCCRPVGFSFSCTRTRVPVLVCSFVNTWQ
jgi:hypothetical protein